MSIPLDKLYHYIEGVAKDVYKDNILIYRFYPHGSKNLDDMYELRSSKNVWWRTAPHIYCHDQEPLNYQLYDVTGYHDENFGKIAESYNIAPPKTNICKYASASLYDQALILHSELRSTEVDTYRNNNCITVYYWCHAIIALDWYRFAQYETMNKSINKQFLIYNRAWSGTREYRLKFVDLLIDHNLTQHCKSTINSIEPELNYHYTTHQFTNAIWKPIHKLENYFDPTIALGTASADYKIEDYNATEFEVVLETLFDDTRLHLTEKILRPIALGQPFLLAATHGSLEYLRSYGFRTFASVIDETYDTIEDPCLRLESIVKSMKEIASWSQHDHDEKMKLVNQIAMYNRRHFFSSKFINKVNDELRANLKTGLAEAESTNTSARFINRRKELSHYPELKADLFNTGETRQTMIRFLQKARSYYNKQ
jgi:hypothetical protein